jgi:type I restriction enzyme M protein
LIGSVLFCCLLFFQSLATYQNKNMAIKKSELYSSLWAGADALRGGMDASQYKDYVLVMLFLKYVSDKSNDPKSAIYVPEGSSFYDAASHKGHKNIGEELNKAIGAIAKENDLQGVIDTVSFEDEDKLGKGKELIDTVSDLIGIFEKPELNFKNNKAEGDDILGDAYEFLMRHFATESGKSKGQFYTPSEVSRILAKVIKVSDAKNAKQTIYDPTCGSGSLLLKAADESPISLSIYGQEKETSTAGLAKMNFIIHGHETGLVVGGYSTLSNPKWFNDNGDGLKNFDFIVANPPFSLKNWTQGFNPSEDLYDRFTGFGIPPEKNGDYSFLLHIIKSLKSTGKAAVILPHGVLFRGNAEAEIRKNILTRGLIKGIIGLPANLFYGTGIPACIIVIDKEDAEQRKGIFMVDASKGFIKDGNKNRLREQDLHKIVDVFNKELEIPKYSRMVSMSEIGDKKNDYNLNIPRYIDSQEPEDIQDIAAHLLGDIPAIDIDSLTEYWEAYPSLKNHLFEKSKREGYYVPKFEQDAIKQTIFNHTEFVAFSANMDGVFAKWNKTTSTYLKSLKTALKPKLVIKEISESILTQYSNMPLLDKYDLYQHLMSYWYDVMQDDMYLISEDGWVAEPKRIIEKNKAGKETDKGWTCDLVPPNLIIEHYLKDEKQKLDQMEADKETKAAQLTELEEEHGGDEGYFADFDKVNKGTVTKRLKEIEKDKDSKDEVLIMKQYMSLIEQQAKLTTDIKTGSETLDKKALAQYAKLTETDVQNLVVDGKWMKAMQIAINSEMERISQRLTQRLKELLERYETPMPELDKQVKDLEEKVNIHLAKMGFLWK